MKSKQNKQDDQRRKKRRENRRPISPSGDLVLSGHPRTQALTLCPEPSFPSVFGINRCLPPSPTEAVSSSIHPDCSPQSRKIHLVSSSHVDSSDRSPAVDTTTISQGLLPFGSTDQVFSGGLLFFFLSLGSLAGYVVVCGCGNVFKLAQSFFLPGGVLVCFPPSAGAQSSPLSRPLLGIRPYVPNIHIRIIK
ncbi:hypothetical protein VTN02DRAFT_573 [Thermoascus thermophilus]